MWIKICGNTNLEDARFAADSGANAVGFVFAPSPRQVNAEQVRQITEKLPPEVEKYGVFVDAGFDEIVATAAAAGLTGVQLHRTSNPLLPFHLRRHYEHLPTRFGILSVLPFSEALEQQLSQLDGDGTLDGGPGRLIRPRGWSAAPAPPSTGRRRRTASSGPRRIYA